MHELYEDLESMCEMLADELSKTNDKLEKSGGQISAGDIEYIDKLTHAIKSIKTTKAMMESEYSNDNRMSYARGGNSYARTNRRGRSRYSRDYSYDENMVAELKELMEDAPDEKTKMEFKKFIRKIESM